MQTSRTREDSAERRLLNVREAAAYIGVSVWSLRGLAATGALPCVEFPSPAEPRRTGRSIRKLLFDVRDLDGFIESSKRTRSAEA